MTTEAEWIKFLEDDHKISSQVWKENGLTFDSRYLYISYFSPSGEFLFKKTREAPTYERGNKYKYPPGAHTTLYLYHKFKERNWIILTEGELDALTLISLGFPATTAGSVTSFKKEFVSYLKGKRVFICFDNDQPGKGASQKVADLLANVGIEVWIVDLSEMENGKDIGDFFRLNNTKEDFIELLKKAGKVELKENTQPSGTETPQGIQKIQLITDPLTYQDVEQKVFNLLPNSSTALKIVLAVAASGNFKNAVMVWLLLVGVPSSGKTDLVRLIKEASFTYYLDNLTLNALISGERPTEKEKVHDLLPLLDKKCLVVKDWTSIFSLDEKMTKKILGDLVGVYDKEFTKFSSRRGQISYSSEFSQLGCVTPATLNRHTNYMNMVGPRFLFYTMPGMTDEEEANSFELIFSGNNRAGIEKEARLYVSSYLSQLIQKTLDIQPLSKEVANYLKIAAKLMACARGIVILQSAGFTDEEGRTNTYYEVLDVQIEQPWRAIQQLTELSTYLAFVTNKQEVGIEEAAIIKEVVISSMPQDRSQALRMIKESNGEVTAKQLSDLSDKSIKTARRLLDELTALNILKKVQGSGNIANGYKITDKFRDFILLDTTEFLSHKDDSGSQTPRGIYTEDELSIKGDFITFLGYKDETKGDEE